MDPLTVVLTVTHVLAFLAGVVVARWLTVRNLKVTEHDGHLALEVRHPDDEETPCQ